MCVKGVVSATEIGRRVVHVSRFTNDGSAGSILIVHYSSHLLRGTWAVSFKRCSEVVFDGNLVGRFISISASLAVFRWRIDPICDLTFWMTAFRLKGIIMGLARF